MHQTMPFRLARRYFANDACLAGERAAKGQKKQLARQRETRKRQRETRKGKKASHELVRERIFCLLKTADRTTKDWRGHVESCQGTCNDQR